MSSSSGAGGGFPEHFGNGRCLRHSYRTGKTSRMAAWGRGASGGTGVRPKAVTPGKRDIGFTAQLRHCPIGLARCVVPE